MVRKDKELKTIYVYKKLRKVAQNTEHLSLNIKIEI